MDRVQKAVELFKEGCNCSQAVVCAYSDLFGMDNNSAMRASEGFGGGMGRMRLTCGAVSGMCMLAGLKYGKGIPKDLETRTKVYDTVQKMAKEFEEKNGSVICGDLLGINKPKDTGAVPTERNGEFYKKRPCVGCVEDCARLVEKYLIETE
ncbi:MAG: C-GCAxxG-C-C family protein [Oscillospiraceae bacterium]|nr:C-GCAxxG-C-C family protein [Oscillospiraceae bacterium]